ncbi:hypothetical protein [Gracilibacillus saliphilus]|uniref:hypothetical protein n=1 Tax=Gracilibacillus saliphilus TaxID=543890 RepID=UPI0013D13BDD|nr:hypothetical protein [Gracilibacillus saliphilus]
MIRNKREPFRNKEAVNRNKRGLFRNKEAVNRNKRGLFRNKEVAIRNRQVLLHNKQLHNKKAIFLKEVSKHTSDSQTYFLRGKALI